jgi:transporter family protein
VQEVRLVQRAWVYAALACLCWGIAPIFEKVGLREAHPLWAIIVRSTLTTVFLATMVIVRREPLELKYWSSFTWANVLLGGIISVLLAQAFYFQALKAGEVGKVVPIVGAYPMVSMVLALVLLGEPLSLAKLVGGLLVVAGVWLLS